MLFAGYCQGDVYACLQGNNVSCRIACPTYGRVTCLTYQNTLACEQYLRERSKFITSRGLLLKSICLHFYYLGSTLNPDIHSAGDSSLSSYNFDALRYSGKVHKICLCRNMTVFLSI